MRITIHVVVAVTLVIVAAAIALPALLAMPRERAIPVERLTVPPEQVRPPLATANRVLNPLIQAYAGPPMITPFNLRVPGSIGPTAVPVPPPPPLQLPEPPLTPFGSAVPSVPR